MYIFRLLPGGVSDKYGSVAAKENAFSFLKGAIKDRSGAKLVRGGS